MSSENNYVLIVTGEPRGTTKREPVYGITADNRVFDIVADREIRNRKTIESLF